MITASLGCVKIYKKPRDTDSRGKYIPKHKRGPDVELFKGDFLSLSFRVIKKKYFNISSIRHDLVLLSQVVSLWLSEATSASTQNQGQSWHIAGAVKRYIWPIARNVDQFIDTFKIFEIVLFFFRISATLPKQSILPFLPFSFWSSPSQSDLN